MAEWSHAEEQQLQELLARKVFASENAGTMADSSSCRISNWRIWNALDWACRCGAISRTAIQYRRIGGESPLTHWCVIVGNVGKNEVRFWKVWEREEELQDGLWRGPRLCCLVSQAFDWIYGKGPSLGLVEVHQSPRSDKWQGRRPMLLRYYPRAWVLWLKSHFQLWDVIRLHDIVSQFFGEEHCQGHSWWFNVQIRNCNCILIWITACGTRVTWCFSEAALWSSSYMYFHWSLWWLEWLQLDT